MTVTAAERFRQIDSLFEAALDRPAHERDDFVTRVAAGDSDLRLEVQRLLRTYELSEGFLDSPAVELAAPLLAGGPHLPGTQIPERIGPFRVVREIGRGGMGAVFLVERDDGQFQQRLAVKLIRQSGHEPALVRRFLSERQILALLDHPRIARLVDGGFTDDGRPYFAMEYVEGEPIDRYCDARNLSVEQRLDLFGEVCHAVQYAHQHLVVHRDLKPSNILVTAAGELKLLDFGIAKLLDRLEPEPGSATTGTGVNPMTPEYAAPEQVRGEPISTATDVYALGVLLYTLLSGKRPYEVRGRSPADVERIICQVDPLPPSALFAGTDPSRGERAGLRSATPDRLRRRLRGDLDLIVMKALRKEPQHRYASAQELAQDIRRHRSGYPVLARRGGAWYRSRRFIGRHRASIAAAAIVVLLLSGYAITATLDRRRVQRALAAATLGTQKAEQVSDFMLGLFEASERGAAFGDTVSARELLSRGTARARELSGQPEIQAQMLDVIGRLRSQLGDYTEAQAVLQEALAMRLRVLGPDHPDVATTLENLAAAVDAGGNPAQAVPLYRDALAIRRRTAGETDSRTLSNLFQYANALHMAGEYAAAQPLLDQWLSIVSTQPREVTPIRAGQLVTIGAVLRVRNEHGRAEPVLREALASHRDLYGDRHPKTAATLRELAGNLRDLGKLDESERAYREVLELARAANPAGHPTTARALRGLALTLQRGGRHGEAEELYRAALDMHRRFAPSDTAAIAMFTEDIATILREQERYAEAEPLARQAVRLYRARFGGASLLTVRAQLTLAEVLRGQGRYTEAEPLLLACYATFRDRRGLGDGPRRLALNGLVQLYEASGQSAKAAEYRALLTP